ncbi:MAG: hypothetical protein AAEJ47_10195 [Planctomycetota bacterium]
MESPSNETTAAMMNLELRRLLDEKIARKTEGIFFLGRGSEAREIFFDGESFHLEDGNSLRWFPVATKKCSRLTAVQLDSLLASWYSETRDLDHLLAQESTIDEQVRTQIIETHRKEVVAESFLLAEDTFLFEPQRESRECNQPGVPATRLEELLEQLTEQQEQSNETLPSARELLVLSPSGVAARDEKESWAFSRIAMLIDGFRTIEEIETDSPFSPSWTRHQLATGAQNGWVYKTNFPELEKLDTTNIEDEKRKLILNRLEAAIRMAADPLMILDKMLQLHQGSGDPSAISKTQMRIVDAHICARDPETAIAILEKIICENPQRSDARKALLKVTVDRGEELLKGSQPEEGRRYLRRAIEASDDDQLRLRLIASHENVSMQIREGVRIASLLYRGAKEDRAIRLIDSLEALHPENVEMQRARIDFLLDHGEEQASEQALERLAAKHAAEGRLHQARELAESVRKLRQKRDPSIVKSTRGYRAIRRVRQLVLLVPFLVIIMVVAKTEFAIQEVIANADTMAPELWKKKASPWLRWLPPGPWKVGLDNAAALVAERVIDQKHTYSTAAQVALRSARNARLLGNVDEMNRQIQQAIRFGAGTEARNLNRKWQFEDQQANQLRDLFNAARKRGDFPKARRWALELIQQHPSNDASVGLIIPIKIESEQNTNIVTDSGKKVALPVWIEVEPFGSKKVILEREGRQTEFVISTEGPETVWLPAP